MFTRCIVQEVHARPIWDVIDDDRSVSDIRNRFVEVSRKSNLARPHKARTGNKIAVVRQPISLTIATDFSRVITRHTEIDRRGAVENLKTEKLMSTILETSEGSGAMPLPVVAARTTQDSRRSTNDCLR